MDRIFGEGDTFNFCKYHHFLSETFLGSGITFLAWRDYLVIAACWK